MMRRRPRRRSGEKSCRTIPKASDSPPTVAEVTMTINGAKSAVELRFPAEPSAEERDALQSPLLAVIARLRALVSSRYSGGADLRARDGSQRRGFPVSARFRLPLRIDIDAFVVSNIGYVLDATTSGVAEYGTIDEAEAFLDR